MRLGLLGKRFHLSVFIRRARVDYILQRFLQLAVHLHQRQRLQVVERAGNRFTVAVLVILHQLADFHRASWIRSALTLGSLIMASLFIARAIMLLTSSG